MSRAVTFAFAMLLASTGLLSASGAMAGEVVTLEPTEVTVWKAVYGRVEARDTVPARARIGGLVVELGVTEGDSVTAGQKIATVRDDKIAFQIEAMDAELRAQNSQLETAQSELERGQKLLERGVTTVQRLDQLRTQTDVLRNMIASTEAKKAVLFQQANEGEVLAPANGRVLSVPVTRGGVVMAGEAIATIGGGGFFLRLAIPERHAASLEEGAAIQISTGGTRHAGHLAKIYPQIENGRVVADVEVEALDTDFVDARVLVEVPIGKREALLVPASAVETRSGIDFVRIRAQGDEAERAVIIGGTIERDGAEYIEILTGLAAGDEVVIQ